jgi:hypothetical protein
MTLGPWILAVSGAAAAAALAIANAPLAASSGKPVLVELFTSQGCSSCPPADELAVKLAQEPGLVVVTRPVTYWDRLGWKDSLAREENTVLQRAYATRGLAGRNGVYTPQMVIDGARGAVGSNAAQIRQLIRQSADAPAAIAVRPQADGALAVGIAGPAIGRGELVLLALSSRETVKIGSGENGGRSVTYVNVLRSERKLADWRGGKLSLPVGAALLRTGGADRYALVLRDANGGAVHAARMVPKI